MIIFRLKITSETKEKFYELLEKGERSSYMAQSMIKYLENKNYVMRVEPGNLFRTEIYAFCHTNEAIFDEFRRECRKRGEKPTHVFRSFIMDKISKDNTNSQFQLELSM